MGGTKEGSEDKINRQKLRQDGIYVEGKIQGTSVNFTVDTGATKTVMSERTYNQIPEQVRPELKGSCSLTSVSGEPLREHGKATFNVELGTEKMEEEIVVADVEDEALLGLDILFNEERHVDIKLSEGEIILNSTSIPCTKVNHGEVVRRVALADDYILPGLSERIVDVFVEKMESDESSEKNEFLIEPSEKFLEKYPILLASCLVDTSEHVTVKVRLINPFSEEINGLQSQGGCYSKLDLLC